MSKLSKTAKVLDTFIKISFRLWVVVNILWVVVILFILYLQLGAPGFITLDDIGAGMIRSLNMGYIGFQLAPDYVIPEGAGQTMFFFHLITGALSIPLYYLYIRFVRNLLKPMIESKPFHETMAINLKRLGWIIIAYGIFEEAYEFINFYFLERYVGLTELFTNETITSISTNHRFSTNFILFAVVLFMLSYVFKYGQELQQLSDETL